MNQKDFIEHFNALCPTGLVSARNIAHFFRSKSVSLSFRRFLHYQDTTCHPGASAELYLSIENGKIRAEVDWCSYGGAEPDIAAQRISLLQDVCHFATSIHGKEVTE